MRTTVAKKTEIITELKRYLPIGSRVYVHFIWKSPSSTAAVYTVFAVVNGEIYDITKRVAIATNTRYKENAHASDGIYTQGPAELVMSLGTALYNDPYTFTHVRL